MLLGVFYNWLLAVYLIGLIMVCNSKCIEFMLTCSYTCIYIYKYKLDTYIYRKKQVCYRSTMDL